MNIGNRTDIEWRPDNSKQIDARQKINNRRDERGDTKLRVDKPDRGDELRNRLSGETGARDISRPGSDREINDIKAKIDRPGGLSGGARDAITDRTRDGVDLGGAAAIAGGAAAGGAAASIAKAKQAAAPKAVKKAAPKAVSKPAVKKPAVRKAAPKSSAVKKRASAPKARSGGQRGRTAAKGKARRR